MSFDEHLYFDGAGSFTSAGIGSSKVFISQAIEISENYQIDTEIRQGAGTVTVIFSFDCGGAMGFLKSVIQYADDISFFSSTNGYEIVLALDFYTYALYRHGRKMRP